MQESKGFQSASSGSNLRRMHNERRRSSSMDYILANTVTSTPHPRTPRTGSDGLDDGGEGSGSGGGRGGGRGDGGGGEEEEEEEGWGGSEEEVAAAALHHPGQTKRLSEMERKLAELMATRDLLRSEGHQRASKAATSTLPDYMVTR